MSASSKLADPFPIAPIVGGEPRADGAQPRRALSARIRVPGSKSLSNRHLVLAALADAPTTLRGLLACDDCDRLLAALSAFGATHRSVPAADGEEIVVEPARPADARPDDIRIDLGDGGTPTRFMIAYAAARRTGSCTVDGSSRMRERPVAEGVEMLRALGARIRYVEAEGRLPVRVDGGALAGGRLRVGRTASSQFASALMLVAPTLAQGLELEFTEEPTSASYLQLSLAALAASGVQAEVAYRPIPVDSTESGLASIRIPPQRIRGGLVSIEPDASSAVYPAAAAALVGGRVLLEGLPRRSVQPDAFFLEDLALRGVRLAELSRDELSRERWSAAPGGGLLVESRGALRGRDADYASAPDSAVMAMVLAAAGDRPSRFTGLHTLRVKESDRIAAVAAGLRALGGTVETGDDWARVHPLPPVAFAATAPGSAASPELRTVIDTVNDHRIAMAFAVLGLVRPGIAIANPGCVAKSWPGFWSAIDLLRGEVPGQNAPR